MSCAGAPDLIHIQLGVPFHHQPVKQIIGQIIELHVEFKDFCILMIVLDIYHGILLAEQTGKGVLWAFFMALFAIATAG